ncbi:FAD-dependent oxidoreductase, partial [Nocardioides sp.]|uniref:FAD-dependent oxidoreductase n=1 Tax=Nocardioides sp. TaxID=35761 RepID=UPI0027347AEC
HIGGTLLAGCDAGDVQQLERQTALLTSQGVSAELLSGREVRALEPTLGPRVGGGVHLPEERSVDPRAVLTALQQRVGEDVVVDGRSPIDPCDATVIATGAVLPEPFTHLVRRVRGEILRVRTDDPPGCTVRGLVHGEPVYVVPRPRPEGANSCDVVVGATAEEHDAAAVVTLGGVARILDAARVLMPGLDRAELVETLARDRPGTPDNLPLVGPSGVPGTTLAAGHYRHGVLLAPLTARLVADHLETGHVEPALDPRRLTDRWSSRSRSDRVETPHPPQGADPWTSP